MALARTRAEGTGRAGRITPGGGTTVHGKPFVMLVPVGGRARARGPGARERGYRYGDRSRTVP